MPKIEIEGSAVDAKNFKKSKKNNRRDVFLNDPLDLAESGDGGIVDQPPNEDPNDADHDQGDDDDDDDLLLSDYLSQGQSSSQKSTSERQKVLRKNRNLHNILQFFRYMVLLVTLASMLGQVVLYFCVKQEKVYLLYLRNLRPSYFIISMIHMGVAALTGVSGLVAFSSFCCSPKPTTHVRQGRGDKLVAVLMFLGISMANCLLYISYIKEARNGYFSQFTPYFYVALAIAALSPLLALILFALIIEKSIVEKQLEVHNLNWSLKVSSNKFLIDEEDQFSSENNLDSMHNFDMLIYPENAEEDNDDGDDNNGDELETASSPAASSSSATIFSPTSTALLHGGSTTPNSKISDAAKSPTTTNNNNGVKKFASNVVVPPIVLPPPPSTYTTKVAPQQGTISDLLLDFPDPSSFFTITLMRVGAQQGVQVTIDPETVNSVAALIKIANRKLSSAREPIKVVEIWNERYDTVQSTKEIRPNGTYYGATQEDIDYHDNN